MSTCQRCGGTIADYQTQTNGTTHWCRCGQYQQPQTQQQSCGIGGIGYSAIQAKLDEILALLKIKGDK